MITAPGQYDLTNNEYHFDPAVSSSAVVNACRSLAHFHEESPSNPAFTPKQPTEAMRIGSAVHSYLLEPEVFEQEYLIAPDKLQCARPLDTVEDLREFLLACDVPFKLSAKKPELIHLARPLVESHGATIWADLMDDFNRRADGRNVVKPEEKRMFMRMAERLGDEDLTLGEARFKMRTLFTAGKPEQSFFWQDKGSGLMCRVRPDWLILTDQVNLIIDYKTTRDARRGLFRSQAENLYYWMRGAMYVDGVYAITGRKCDYVLVAQEKEAPYLAGAFNYPQHIIEAGQALYQEKLMEIAKARTSGVWPGYTDQLQSLDLSQYVIDRHPVVKDLLYGGQ